jgi:hypothetical protein
MRSSSAADTFWRDMSPLGDGSRRMVEDIVVFKKYSVPRAT